MLERAFPGLSPGSWRPTSPVTPLYNCIAWAAGEATRWWWPEHGYWPDAAPRIVSVDAFVAAFGSLGYEVTNNLDLQPGLEKVALYVDDQNRPTHAARQLPSGHWTSKLGGFADIEHALGGLEGQQYGTVRVILSRPV